MQFLKILFWCLIAFIAAVFTIGNWTWITIKLFGNLVAEVNLPLLLLVTFLVGFLPTYLYYNAIRWRLRQRLGAAERSLGDIRVAASGYSPTVMPEPAGAQIDAAPTEAAPTPVRRTRKPRPSADTPDGGLL